MMNADTPAVVTSVWAGGWFEFKAEADQKTLMCFLPTAEIKHAGGKQFGLVKFMLLFVPTVLRTEAESSFKEPIQCMITAVLSSCFCSAVFGLD